MNIDPHTTIAVQKWSSHYPTFNEAYTNVCPRIFKLPFKTVRDTKIQTFLYRIIQKIIQCNKLLHNIKIKSSPNCDYCKNEDRFSHYFIRCQKVAEFWTHCFNWWENLSSILIKDSQVIEEYILFGFPSNSDTMQVLNFLFNNNTLDLYVCLTQLKQYYN